MKFLAALLALALISPQAPPTAGVEGTWIAKFRVSGGFETEVMPGTIEITLGPPPAGLRALVFGLPGMYLCHPSLSPESGYLFEVPSYLPSSFFASSTTRDPLTTATCVTTFWCRVNAKSTRLRGGGLIGVLPGSNTYWAFSFKAKRS